MPLTVGSFNMHRLGNQPDRDFALISQIITKESFDVVALQEVPNSGSLEKIRFTLSSASGTGWEYFHAPTGGGFGFAYLWKTSRLSPVTGLPIRLWDGPGCWVLKRRPLIGMFAYDQSVFALINVHMIGNATYSIEKQAEFRHLCCDVYPAVEYKAFGKNLVGYVIMMGDYNLYYSDIVNRANPDLGISIDTFVEPSTTLKNREPYDYADNEAVDHFSYRTSCLKDLHPMPSRVDALHLYAGGDGTHYFRHVSDHVPIKLTLQV